MAKPRRNVKFAHRSSLNTSSDFGGSRRDSLSGDDNSPLSPLRNGVTVDGADSHTGSGSPVLKVLPPTETKQRQNVKTSNLLTRAKTPPQEEPPPLSEYEKKKQTFITRTIWTLVMIGTFFWAMAAGHLYIVALVSAVQVITFKEVIAIANVPSREKKLQFTKSLNWYFLAATMYFLYGESVIYYFKHIVLVDALLLPLATHHRFISFILYMMGTIARVLLDSPALLMDLFRFRILRRLSQEGTLQISIYTIRMDSHGPLSCRCPVALHHEQCL